MTRLILALSLVALACGAPVLAVPLPTTTATVEPTVIPPAAISHMTYISRHVDGCWNVRAEPGGLDTGERCNTTVVVYAQPVNGWYELISGGWICARGIGENVKCPLD